ncbi:hypothetical protein E2C01_057886 [Portunus trituberculatus]|uniref:Uncharacterized protein n=1 Tax=Portunus trituberculatus TaxID=210409 RepID=A0A5B7H174_PORTR|nr:hypothetical protein [Portunus trituberculatus]
MKTRHGTEEVKIDYRSGTVTMRPPGRQKELQKYQVGRRTEPPYSYLLPSIQTFYVSSSSSSPFHYMLLSFLTYRAIHPSNPTIQPSSLRLTSHAAPTNTRNILMMWIN